MEGACISMRKMSCEDCKFYYDGRKQKVEHGKCVWIPSEERCRSMRYFNESRKSNPDLEFDEICTGKCFSPVIMHKVESEF